jgi:hypothetical protein
MVEQVPGSLSKSVTKTLPLFISIVIVTMPLPSLMISLMILFTVVGFIVLVPLLPVAAGVLIVVVWFYVGRLITSPVTVLVVGAVSPQARSH